MSARSCEQPGHGGLVAADIGQTNRSARPTPRHPGKVVGALNVLVAYASRHGATQGIGERIAERLRAAGLGAEAQPVAAVRDISAYQVFVTGSAAYLGHWQQEAPEFVRHNHRLIQRRSTWLFSSGPLVKEPSEALGLDQREAAVPNEVGEFRKAICSRGDRVFAGALNPGQLGFLARAIRILPAGRALLPAGDFRDWRDIDAWADGIVRELVASDWRD